MPGMFLGRRGAGHYTGTMNLPKVLMAASEGATFAAPMWTTARMVNGGDRPATGLGATPRQLANMVQITVAKKMTK